MKRISALICALMMAVTLFVPAVYADSQKDSGKTVSKAGLELLSSSPENGAKGVAVDNLSVKIYFSKDVQPKNAKVRENNAKQCRLKDAEGTRIPVKVYYSDDEEGLILIAADTFSSKNKKKTIKGDMQYTLTIGRDFKAADGSILGQQQTISMKTLNQGRSTVIYMLLMALMMAGMIFFALRGSKKEEKKKQEEREYKEGVNPYKQAKKSGKSVEEIVAKESKKKAKKEEAIRKQKEAEAAIEAEILEKIRKESNKRVAAPKAVSSVGSKCRLKVVTDKGNKVQAKEAEAQKPKSNKGTTNPKGQSGKNRNRKKKK